MNEKKPTPIRTRILIVLLSCFGALLIWAFALGPLMVYLVIPCCARLTASDRPLGIWLLLALLAGLLVWALLLLRKKKHRLLLVFCALFLLFTALQASPYLDREIKTPTPELAAAYPSEDPQDYGEEIYHNAFLFGGSMRTKPSDNMPSEAQAKLKALMEDSGYTWIVTYGRELTGVTWSFRDPYVWNSILPWRIGMTAEHTLTTIPGDPNLVYIWRIPFAPIDNID